MYDLADFPCCSGVGITQRMCDLSTQTSSLFLGHLNVEWRLKVDVDISIKMTWTSASSISTVVPMYGLRGPLHKSQQQNRLLPDESASVPCSATSSFGSLACLRWSIPLGWTSSWFVEVILFPLRFCRLFVDHPLQQDFSSNCMAGNRSREAAVAEAGFFVLPLYSLLTIHSMYFHGPCHWLEGLCSLLSLEAVSCIPLFLHWKRTDILSYFHSVFPGSKQKSQADLVSPLCFVLLRRLQGALQYHRYHRMGPCHSPLQSNSSWPCIRIRFSGY